MATEQGVSFRQVIGGDDKDTREKGNSIQYNYKYLSVKLLVICGLSITKQDRIGEW